MEKEKRKLFSGFDVIIILFIILFSILMFILNFNKSDNLVAVVRYNGKVLNTYYLQDYKEPCTMHLKGDLDLDLVISSEGVKVINSTCPDKLCEKTNMIKQNGQSIVCLPARISVSLEDETSEKSVDSVIG